MQELKKEYIESLQAQKHKITELWQAHNDQVVDWQKYFLKFQFELMRWLVGIAVAVLGLSQIISEGGGRFIGNPLILLSFIVSAVFFDIQRTRRAYNIQRSELDSKSASDFFLGVGREVENIFLNKTEKDDFNKLIDRLESMTETALIITFFIGCLLAFTDVRIVFSS